MNEQLEPCPFCGHAMMYFEHDCSWNVFDTNIRCPVQPSLLHNLETREATIAAWNTRAPVESGTVSGEEFDWIDGHACVTGDCPHGREAECAETLRALCIEVAQSLKQRAPPLSPATPSAELRFCVCEHLKNEHRDGKGGCTHDAGDLLTGKFCGCDKYTPKAAVAAPSAELIAAADELVEAAGIALGATATTQAREGLRVAIAAYDAERRTASAKGN